MENNVQQQPAQQIPENLTPQQALGLLIQGVNFAQSKGIYTLKDAALLEKAVSTFATPEGNEQTGGTNSADSTENTTDAANPTVGPLIKTDEVGKN